MGKSRKRKTTAEQLRTEARAEGRTEGRAEMLLDMLTMKFGPLPLEVASKVQGATADQLHEWGARAWTASTLAEAGIR